MGVHSRFLEKEAINFGLSDLYQDYHSNPYLQPLINPVIAKNLPFVNSPEWGNEPFNEDAKAYLDSAYAWQRILYDTQSLAIHGRVPFQKASQHYRRPVISAAKQLRLISEINYAEQKKLGGVINQGAFLVGLSDFVEENAQEELNIHFLSKFKENLKELPELQILFPNTLNLFEQFEITNYRVLLENAQPAFAFDLQEIPLNLPKILELPKFEELHNSPEVYNLVLFYRIANLVYQSLPVDTILLKGFEEINERYFEFSDKADYQLGEQLWKQPTRSDLREFRNLVNNYAHALRVSYEQLDKISSDLTVEVDRLKDTIDRYDFLKPDKILEESMNGVKTASPEYSDFYYHGAELVGTGYKVFDFYEKVMDANLQGYSYYDTTDLRPDLATFDRFYGQKPQHWEMVAKSITFSRDLAKAKDAEQLRLWQQSLKLRAATTKELTEKVWTQIRQRDQLLNALKLVDEKRAVLDSAIILELSQYVGTNEGDDRFMIHALKYLKSLLDIENDPWQQIDFFIQIEDGEGEEQARLLSEGHTLFEGVMTRAKVRIDTLANPYWHLLVSLDQRESAFIANKLNAIEQLITNLDEETDRINALLSDYPKGILRTLSQLENKNKLDSNILRSRENVKHLRSVLELAIHLIHAVQYKRGDGGSKRWMNLDEYKNLMSNDTTKAAFLGLLYQRLKSLKQQPHFSEEFIALMATKLLYSTYRLSDLRDSIKIKSPEDIKFRDYYPFIRSSVDLISTLISTPYRDEKTLSDSIPQLRAITCLADNALSIYENVYAQKYGNAIFNAMDIFKIILDADYKRKSNALSNKEKKALEKKRTNQQKVKNAVLHYGTFMANVVDAERSEEVKAALKAAALPAGNSRIKREVNFNMSINSFFSLAYGNESLENEARGIQKNNGSFFGLSVPVGLSFSWATRKGDALGIFASLLDLGAITAFRLDNKDARVELLPEVTFENLFAPGFSFIYHRRNSPFSIGYSRQFGPRVRKLQDSEGTALMGTRDFIFVGIDVPIFNLIGGSKKLNKKEDLHSCFNWSTK